MKTLSFSLLTYPSITALVLSVLLTACGGQQEFQDQFQATAAAAPTPAVAAGAAPVAAPVVAAATNAAPTIVAANMPAPDCAAEGCAGLRIIDGNAEAWRIDAARRAAFEAQL